MRRCCGLESIDPGCRSTRRAPNPDRLQMPKSTSVSTSDLGSVGFFGSAEFFAPSEVRFAAAGLARDAVALPFAALAAPPVAALLLDLLALADALGTFAEAFALASLEPRPLSFVERARDSGSWLVFQDP